MYSLGCSFTSLSCLSLWHLHYIAVRVPDCSLLIKFLSALAKLRKATVSFDKCLSVRMEHLSLHWTDFNNTLHFGIFRKYVQNSQVWLKSDKNDGYFTQTHVHIYIKTCTHFIIFRSILLRMRNVSDKILEKIRIHILFMFNNFIS